MSQLAHEYVNFQTVEGYTHHPETILILDDDRGVVVRDTDNGHKTIDYIDDPAYVPDVYRAVDDNITVDDFIDERLD